METSSTVFHFHTLGQHVQKQTYQGEMLKKSNFTANGMDTPKHAKHAASFKAS
jgi:hypothetical protein